VFAARYELNSYIVFRKRLVSKRLRTVQKYFTDKLIVFNKHVMTPKCVTLTATKINM
jgi:hypothetical protein